MSGKHCDYTKATSVDASESDIVGQLWSKLFTGTGHAPLTNFEQILLLICQNSCFSHKFLRVDVH